MNTHRLDVGLIGLCILLAGAAIHRWRHGLDDVIATSGARTVAPIRRAPPPLSAALLDSAVDMTVSNDPFRLASAPASVAYDPAIDVPAGAAPLRPVALPLRPMMVVRGIMGGPPWQAIMDGIPGQPVGAIVRSGMTFDRLSVRSVGRDTVIMQAPDTTWKLTIGGR